MCARWVPKKLRDEQKRMCLGICSCNLAHLLQRWQLSAIDHHRWWNLGSSLSTNNQVEEHAVEASVITRCKKFKMQPSAGKLMLTIFWDSQGPILEIYLVCRTTVASATYFNMLQGELKSAIDSKKRGRLLEGILLLHNNAYPHMQPTHWKPSGNWSGKSWNTQLTVQVLHHLTVTFWTT